MWARTEPPAHSSGRYTLSAMESTTSSERGPTRTCFAGMRQNQCFFSAGAAAAIMDERNRAPWAVRIAVRATHASRRIAVARGAMGWARTFDSIDDGPHPDHLLRVVADDEEREDALDLALRERVRLVELVDERRGLLHHGGLVHVALGDVGRSHDRSRN